MNPPSLIWNADKKANSYILQWAQNNDFSNAVTIENIPWMSYTHNEPLKQGTYYWRVKSTGEWSSPLSFTIPADAIEMPMLTRAQQKEKIPKDHPRLFMRPESVAKLKELAKGSGAEAFDFMREAADRDLQMNADEPPFPKFNRWEIYQRLNDMGQKAEGIALVYLITGEQKYGGAARRILLEMCA